MGQVSFLSFISLSYRFLSAIFCFVFYMRTINELLKTKTKFENKKNKKQKKNNKKQRNQIEAESDPLPAVSSQCSVLLFLSLS